MPKTSSVDPSKAVAYLRVSTDTDRQALGAEAQRVAIQRWAESQGITILGWFVEEVSGGAPLDKRPVLLEAIATVAGHGASSLVVQRLDRFSRDPLTAALAESELRKNGASLAVARLEEGDVRRSKAPQTAEAREQDGVLRLVMAEQEAARGERLRNGDFNSRGGGDRVQRADERVVNRDKAVMRLDEGVHFSGIQVQVSLRSRPPLLTIGQVVKRSGVAASALRFYEERGLIGSVRVGAGKGHRRYGRSVLRRIAFIVFAQRIGLSLDEIALELAKLPNGFLTRKDWARLGKEWDARVKARMAELERLRASLTTCIGCGCLSLDVCPLSNPEDRAGRAGAGPRFWLGDKRPSGRQR